MCCTYGAHYLILSTDPDLLPQHRTYGSQHLTPYPFFNVISPKFSAFLFSISLERIASHVKCPNQTSFRCFITD